MKTPSIPRSFPLVHQTSLHGLPANIIDDSSFTRGCLQELSFSSLNCVLSKNWIWWSYVVRMSLIVLNTRNLMLSIMRFIPTRVKLGILRSLTWYTYTTWGFLSTLCFFVYICFFSFGVFLYKNSRVLYFSYDYKVNLETKCITSHVGN